MISLVTFVDWAKKIFVTNTVLCTYGWTHRRDSRNSDVDEFNPTFEVQNLGNEAFQNDSFGNASFPNGNKGYSCLWAKYISSIFSAPYKQKVVI